MAGFDIKAANEEEEILKALIKDFQVANTNPEFVMLNMVLERMLDWNFETRFDFYDLVDEINYNYNEIDLKIKKQNLNSIIFVSKNALDENWWFKAEDMMKNGGGYFSSGGWLSLKIPTRIYTNYDKAF